MSEPSPSRADSALLLALEVWGHGPAIRDRLAPGWRDRLAASSAEAPASEAPLDRLRRDHEMAMRADLGRVHPSWWARALQGESSTVRRAVVAFAPDGIRERFRNELALRRDELVAERPPLPAAVACLLSLWAEPFAGGPPPGPDDPPVVTDLATRSRNELTRLLSMAGLAKLAAVGDGTEPAPTSSRVRARLERFRAAWEGLPGELVAVAARDVERHEGLVLSNLPRLGLVTVARLLAPLDPSRRRWALQHLPYSTAKFVRAEMDADPPGPEALGLAEWESRVWAMARDRMADEHEPGGGE